MRKHFLLLLLMTLLPLAGWAITEVNVRAKVFEVDYGKANPLTVDPNMLRLSIEDNAHGDLAAAIAAKLTYTTDRLASDAVSNESRTYTISLKLPGDDVVEVDLDDNGTPEEYAINITSATAAMKITKATTGTFEITGIPAFVTAGLSYDGNSKSLVTSESVAIDAFYGKVNTLTNLPMEFSVNGGATWQDNAEVTNANTVGYSLMYRIKGYGVNFEANAAKGDLGENKKVVAKATITLTPGNAATNLTYDGQTHQLLTSSVTASAFNPALVYSVDKHNGTNYPETYTALADIDDIEDLLLTNAGKYKVKCDISAADKANLEVTGGAWVSDEIEIAKANAIVTAPAALKPSYTNALQPLISAGEAISGATIKYCTTNSDIEADWTTVIPQGDDAGNYTAWYKVAASGDGNWDAVPATQITGVTIEKAIVTVKVNNISKVYDGTNSLANATIDDGKPKFTFITLQTGDNAADYAAVPYSAVEAVNASDNAYVGVVTIATDALTAINANYAYYVQPGNLTIGKSQLTITATNTNAAYGVANAATIANAYTIKDQNNADVAAATAFEADHFPVLTSAGAAAAEYKPGTYDVTFSEGTIKAGGNYEVAENGYVIGDAKFVIGKASQVIITVIPKEVQYGTAEDWTATPVQDVDYYVANLLPGDEITSISLTREGAGSEYDVKSYALTATATIAHPDWYANNGDIIFNNSTFTITPRKLTATIAQQTIVKDVEDTFDNTMWDVTPMQFDQPKSVLGATLELAAGASSTTGTKNDGIILTITNSNYVLVGDNVTAGKAHGTLHVISATDFALNPEDVNLPSELAAVNPETNYSIVFKNKTTTIGEWYAMVLPFDVDPLKMVQAFGRYVIFNELNTAGTDDGNFKFKLTLDKIPAGKPFMIKFAKKDGDTDETVVNWATEFNKATYGTVKIKKDINDVETDYVVFTGTYTAKNLKGLKDGNGEKVWWLANSSIAKPNTDPVEYYDNNWKKPKTNMHTAAPMEAYLTAEGKTWTSYAPNITVEDFDGSVTAIKSLSADEIHGLNVKGMYNLNGMKMNNVPTQKGIYIINGKKVVIK